MPSSAIAFNHVFIALYLYPFQCEELGKVPLIDGWSGQLTLVPRKQISAA
jgi:hypothetical protein